MSYVIIRSNIRTGRKVSLKGTFSKLTDAMEWAWEAARVASVDMKWEVFNTAVTSEFPVALVRGQLAEG